MLVLFLSSGLSCALKLLVGVTCSLLLTKTPYTYYSILAHLSPSFFPPFWTKTEWHFHKTSIPHTLGTSEAGPYSLKLPFLTPPRKGRKISKCLDWARLSGNMEAQRTHWVLRGEDWEMPSLLLPSRSRPSLYRPLDTALCGVQGSEGHYEISPSGRPHILDSFIVVGAAPAPLPCPQTSLSVFSSQSKAQDCPWLVVPPLYGSPGRKAVPFSHLLFLSHFLQILYDQPCTPAYPNTDIPELEILTGS